MTVNCRSDGESNSGDSGVGSADSQEKEVQQGEGEADKENLGQCGVPGNCRGVSAFLILSAGITLVCPG